MKVNIAKLAGAIALLSASNVDGTTVRTCTLDYTGAINAIDVDNGVVTGVAKLYAKESEGDEPYTLVAKNGDESQRYGTITTTIDLSQFASDGVTCAFDNRFTPLHSISESRPWRQFQMRFDSIYDSNIMTTYNHNGIQTRLMISNGWTWGTDIATIHVFEMRNGEFFPVKYDVDQGLGELPAYSAGGTDMSTSGDGGRWQYRASAASDDGRLIAGYAQLEEGVNFDKGSVISAEDKFGFIWEVTDSCSLDGSKCGNANASRLTTGSVSSNNISVQSLSASPVARDTSEKAVFSNGENISIESSALRNGQVIRYDSIPTDFTIGYRFTNGQDGVACTLIDAEGALEQNKLERIDPYVIYGDQNAGEDYNTRNKSVLGEGELNLSIRVFDNRNCDGDPYFTDSITININKTDNNEASGEASNATGTTTGEFYLVNRQVNDYNFEMLTYDGDSTMHNVYGISTISPGKYMINGRSSSGKAMVVLVTL